MIAKANFGRGTVWAIAATAVALSGCGLDQPMEANEDVAALEEGGTNEGDGEGDQGGDGEGGAGDVDEELFEELLCDLEPTPYEIAVENAEQACQEYRWSCTADVVGLGADILGQVLPVDCGIEFPVGMTIATVIGWDPNKGLANPDLAIDLLCQVAECMPPTDPFVIGAKSLCVCNSLARTIRHCTELYNKCSDAEGEVPIVDDDGVIVNPQYQCPITPPTVQGCFAGAPRDTDDLVIDCAHAVDRRRDDIDNDGYGDCVSQCVNMTKEQDCGPPDDPADENVPL